jgi:hypothetical protein
MCLHVLLAIVFAEEGEHSNAAFGTLASGNGTVILFLLHVTFIDVAIEMSFVCKPSTAC